VVGASNQRLEKCLDQSGHLTDAPGLVVEILSTGIKDQKRDIELKLKLYSTQGVQEYWILDYQQQQVNVYRRRQAVLELAATLLAEDTLTSHLLSEFSCPVAELFL
jgi:Uma2 family endonuclease